MLKSNQKKSKKSITFYRSIESTNLQSKLSVSMAGRCTSSTTTTTGVCISPN